MRSTFAADPRAVVQTLRALLAECREESARLAVELRQWEARAGVRPADGSDQPSLFAAERQPTLFGG
jgi:hypothetical protein